MRFRAIISTTTLAALATGCSGSGSSVQPAVIRELPDSATKLIVAQPGVPHGSGALTTYTLDQSAPPTSIAPPPGNSATYSNEFIGVARDTSGNLYAGVELHDVFANSMQDRRTISYVHDDYTISFVEYPEGSTTPQTIVSDVADCCGFGFNLSRSLVVDGVGELLGADGSTFQRITPVGTASPPVIIQAAGAQANLSQSAIAIDPGGNVELVGFDRDSNSAAIETLTVPANGGTTTNASVLPIHGVNFDVENTLSLAIDASGIRYVAQAEGPVLVFSARNTTGEADRQAPIQASAIATDPRSGNVFLSEAQSPYAIVEMDPHFRLIRTIATTQAAPASQLLVY